MPSATLPDSKGIEKQIDESIAYYKMAGYFWRILHYLLGVLATILTSLPAAREFWPTYPSIELWGKIGAIGAPLMVSLLSFTQAKPYSDSWFLAWRILKTAKGKYQLGEISATELLSHWNEAEAIGIKDVSGN